MIRICPKRDAICPHGMTCPYAIDRYSCKPQTDSEDSKTESSTEDKHCITCGKNGHTYLECPTVDFLSLFCHSVGAPVIVGQSKQEVLDGIAEIEDSTGEPKV